MAVPDISEYVKTGALPEIIRGTLDLCAKSLVKHGTFSPVLIVIIDGDYLIMNVPDGQSEMAGFFIEKVEDFRGRATAYIFITETWSLSLSTTDIEEIKKYTFNPGLIVGNPFKEERLAFYGATRKASYSGYVPFVHEDDGSITAKDLIFDEDLEETEAFVNIADLLLPMVQ